MDGIDLAQNMDKWRATLNAIINIRVPVSIKCGEFLD
jgi:hypothetical protein